ncbi:proline-rich protein 15 [Sarcophilus harrisii]|uniref:Proline rich 15 n=1 Tax=Sarcophilus harrisii TaxID=9305 RepID=A0A7N4PVK3_SARHA|nr:proline-rich protein 15 [Sarcophilus harrisii]
MADGGGGGGGGSSGPWWKSFTIGGRKKGKDGGGGGSAGAQPPPAPAPQPGPREPSPARQDCQHPGLPGPGEPPRLERLGEENLGSSRRNLKISRSGRFKEKRKVRATLLPDGTKPPDDSGFPCAPREERQ